MGFDGVARVQPVAAVNVDADVQPRGADDALGGPPHLKVPRADRRTLDPPGRARRGDAILNRRLLRPPAESGHMQTREPGGIPGLVGNGQAMRVVDRIEDADVARIVARPSDVAAEIALPAGRQDAAGEEIDGPAEDAVVRVA